MATSRSALCLALTLTLAAASGAALGVTPSAGAVGWPDAASAAGESDAGVVPLLRVAPLSTRARLGETIVFVAEVTNGAATDLVGLRVVSETGEGVSSLLGTRTDNGVFDPATSTWFIDRVEAGATATLELFARAEATGTARVALLAAADDPTGTVGTAEASLEVTDWAVEARGDRSAVSVAAGVLLTTGGVLVVAAGLVSLNRRRRSPDVGVLAQVANEPE